MVIHFTTAVTATLQALERRCPKCQHKQVVPASKANESVPCAKCGAQVPPKTKR